MASPQTSTKDTEASEYMTYADVAAEFAIPVATLYYLVNKRRIPHVRFGPRFVRFERAALREWFASHRVRAVGSN